MRFVNHLELAGKHSFLAPSKHSWLNYDEEKLSRVYLNAMAAKRGSDLHDLAARLITLGEKLPDSPRTLNMYVNDAIGFKLAPEQVLYVSDNCFGTADAIGLVQNTLRIADLKTGEIVASVEQLEIYAAMFCLEYKYKPFDLDIELRIYQNNECRIYDADPQAIFGIMEHIKFCNKLIEGIKRELEN